MNKSLTGSLSTPLAAQLHLHLSHLFGLPYNYNRSCVSTSQDTASNSSHPFPRRVPLSTGSATVYVNSFSSSVTVPLTILLPKD